VAHSRPSPERTPYDILGAGAPEFRAWLMQQFFATADWMRNKPGDMPGSG
jgi:hypothetical protein